MRMRKIDVYEATSTITKHHLFLLLLIFFKVDKLCLLLCIILKNQVRKWVLVSWKFMDIKFTDGKS